MYDMIKIKVKLYAPFSNYVDRKRIEVDIDENATFIDILQKVAEVYPKFRDAIPDVTDRCVFYNNMVPVIDSSVIGLHQKFKDGDEISLFGSISGG
jgi:molybdopterin converting factor small subunit